MARSTTPDAPDLDYLLALRTELEALYQQDNKQIEDARQVREMAKPALSGADERYRLVDVDPRDPAIADEAFRTQASLTINRPKLSCKSGGPYAESDAAQTRTTQRENWTEEVLWAAGTRAPGQDTWRDAADACLFDGGAWTKLLWTKDDWTERYKLKKPADAAPQERLNAYSDDVEEAKKRLGPPFVWQHVDTLAVNPVWSNGTLSEVLEVTERPHYSTLRKYRLKRDDQGNICPGDLGQPQGKLVADSKVTFLEHWDERWVSYTVLGKNLEGAVTGHMVAQWKHRYGFVPYDFAPGLWMNHWRNRKTGWGISQTKRWLVEYRAWLRAMHAQYVARDLLSPLIRTRPEGAGALVGTDGQPLPRSDDAPMPGTMVNGDPGEDIKVIPYPRPENLEAHMQMVDKAINDLSSPQITSLDGLEGAGFAISQVLSYENVKTGQIQASLARMLKGTTQKVWRLTTDRVQETVWVEQTGEQSGYLGLGPDDLKHSMQATWEVNPERATDNLIKARYVHERISAGTMSPDQGIEFLGDNPDEVRLGIAKHELRQTDEYKLWQKVVVFQKAGRGDLLGKAALAELAAQQGTIPGVSPNGAPGQPGMPGTPDFAALASSPNGAGVALAPTNGMMGTSPGAVVPEAGAVGGMGVQTLAA